MPSDMTLMDSPTSSFTHDRDYTRPPLPVLEARPSRRMPHRSAASNGYVAKRLAALNGDIHPQSIPNLDQTIQYTFRLRLFSLFSAQLLAVAGLVALIVHSTNFSNSFDTFMNNHRILLLLWLIFAVILLFLLHRCSRDTPINYIMLAIFTLAESFLFAGIDLWAAHQIGVFSCLFIAGFICTLTISSTRTFHDKLLSLWAAGGLAYALTVSISVLYVYLSDTLSWRAAGICIGVESILALWILYDANEMQKCIQERDYMRGVVYFYADILLLLALVGSFLCLAAGCDGCDGCNLYCIWPIFLCDCSRSNQVPEEQRMSDDESIQVASV